MSSTQGPGRFDTFALNLFGDWAHRRITRHPELPRKLAQAGEPLVPVAFLAGAYLRTIIAALVGVFVFVFYILVALAANAFSTGLMAAFAALPFLLATANWGYEMLRPDIAMRARKADIEANLPYALNFLAALASAGVVPQQMFGALAKQHVYGEVRVEAARIYRDSKLFGKDIIDVMHDASRRTPSRQFDEFLQGAINTITSGGNLRSYLINRAEQFTEENRRRSKTFLESLSVMAESYVVIAAAFPLFLIVILSVLGTLNPAAKPMLFLNIITLLVLPVIHGAFAGILRNMRPAS